MKTSWTSFAFVGCTASNTSRTLAVAFALAAAGGVIGCASDTGSQSEKPASQAFQSLTSGDAARAAGIARYDVGVDATSTTVRLFDDKAVSIGEIVSYSARDAHRVFYSHGEVHIEFEYLKDRVSVWVNGQDRGVATFPANHPADGTQLAVPAGALDLSDLAPELATMQVVGQDNQLRQAADALRAQVPYMFGWSDCPPWVWIGTCVAAGTPPGAAVCAYCTIAWL